MILHHLTSHQVTAICKVVVECWSSVWKPKMSFSKQGWQWKLCFSMSGLRNTNTTTTFWPIVLDLQWNSDHNEEWEHKTPLWHYTCQNKGKNHKTEPVEVLISNLQQNNCKSNILNNEYSEELTKAGFRLQDCTTHIRRNSCDLTWSHDLCPHGYNVFLKTRYKSSCVPVTYQQAFPPSQLSNAPVR